MKTERTETACGELVSLIADPGKMLTDQQETFFAEILYLGKNDSPENYHEVGREYAEDRSRPEEKITHRLL